MTKVGRPPVLRVRHQGMKVLGHGIQVETLEFFGVVELLAHRIRQVGVLVKNLQVQLVWPPVTVGVCGSCTRERALGFSGLVCYLSMRINNACWGFIFHMCIFLEISSKNLLSNTKPSQRRIPALQS